VSPSSRSAASSKGRLFRFESGSASELFWAYRISLCVLADRKSLDLSGQGNTEKFDDKIFELLKDTEDNIEWEKLYEAEQRLTHFLTDAEIVAETTRRLEEAEHLGVKSVPAIRTAFQNSTTSPERKALFASLLDDVHFRYLKRSLDRKTRRLAGSAIILFGTTIMFFTVLFLVALGFPESAVFIYTHHMVLVLWFGIVGAFLSRVIVFQASLEKIDYDALRSGFSAWTIIVRLILGAFCAVIFAFLISGRLVDGALFPDILALVGPPSTSEMKAMPIEERRLSFVDQNLAKLIVWSTIAGFSERLIPDRFANLESRIDEKKS
jgi:hypothetical protein